jgi:hypothetical protein
MVKNIVRNEGGYSALYRGGFVPNTVGNSVSWALYFVSLAELMFVNFSLMIVT